MARAAFFTTLVTAALLGSVQSLAGAAIAAGAQGRPVMVWCLGLAALTGVRVAGAILAARLTVRAQAAWLRAAAAKHGPVLIHGGDPDDLETARAAGAIVLRTAGELSGLALGSLVVVVIVDPLAAWCWLAALGAAAWTLRPRGLARSFLRAARCDGARVVRCWSEAAIVARALGAVPALMQADAAAQADAWCARRNAERVLAGRVRLAQALLAVGQVVVAVLVLQEEASAGTSLGGAVAAMLITTTVVARGDLAAPLLRAWHADLAARRRLAHLPPPSAEAHALAGPMTIALPGLGVVEAGTIVAVPESAVPRSWAVPGSKATAGQRVLACHPAGAVVHVPREPALAAGPLARNLDPTGLMAPARLRAALAEVGLEHLQPRLELALGPHGSGLSGGEQWRVALAGALLTAPGLLVLEDPGQALDQSALTVVAAALRAHRAITTIVLVGGAPALVAAADRFLEAA